MKQKRQTRVRTIVILAVILIFTGMSCSQQDVTGVGFTATSVKFIMQNTGGGSLNVPLQGRVCNEANTIMFAGNTETFMVLGESIFFTVDFPEGTFQSGETINLSTTDQLTSPDCNGGSTPSKGYLQTWVYKLPEVVSSSNVFGVALFILLSLMFGLFSIRRTRSAI